MCIFITAIIPADFDFVGAKSTLEKHAMLFKPLTNQSLESQLNGDRAVLARSSVCDCNTSLGCRGRLESTEQKYNSYLAEIGKLQKKGWSESKIKRWLKEKENSAERKIHEVEDESNEDLENWIEFITGFFSQNLTNRLGLMIHMFNGGLSDERIMLKGFERLEFTVDLIEKLKDFEEDTVYMISKTPMR